MVDLADGPRSHAEHRPLELHPGDRGRGRGGGGEEDPFYELPFVVVERSLVAGGATVSGACGCGKGGGALRPLPP